LKKRLSAVEEATNNGFSGGGRSSKLNNLKGSTSWKSMGLYNQTCGKVGEVGQVRKRRIKL
jgi:hypothetical protein